ncbi:MAG TPA: trigger factor [Gaiellaceae bacterium]|nr:trigger factor [Gaiellaceae bacterium]
MESQLEQLDGDRVRLTVEVPAHDVHHAVEHATSDLAGRVKVPGFRPGKVPAQVLLSRVGKERLYTEAVDSHIGNWFWSAVARSRVRPVEAPRYDYELPRSADEDWRFTAEFAVEAKPEPADWSALEVPRAAVEVPAEAVTEELERLQRVVADLSPVDSRPAQPGDVVVVDIVSEAGYGQRDYVFELGAERLVDEIENGVRGLLAGESREVAWELADGSRRTGTVTLKELHEKVLPPLDDEVAKAVSEFDTLDELRGDIESRIRERLEEEAQARFRQAAVDELVKASRVDPEGLTVEMRTRELLQGFVRTLQRRGIDPNAYLQVTNTTAAELEGRLRAEAKQSIARELVLEAVADKLGLDVTDDEIRAELREQGEADEDIDEFFERGGAERVRPDLRMRKALDRIAAEVKPIAPERAEARESIWTPEKEEEKTTKPKKLWTPGSKES